MAILRRLIDWCRAPGRSRLWRLSLHSGLQITGQVLPLLVAAVAVPVIYRRIGASDFGVFTLALSALGMFAIMDLGLGRSTVRFVTHALARGEAEKADAIASQSAALLGGFSVLLTLVVITVLPARSAQWLHTQGETAVQLRHVIYILGVSIPFIGLTSTARSLLESRERFPTIALIQGAFGSLSYGVPLILSFMTRDVRVIVAGAVACRILAFGAFWTAAREFWSGAVLRGVTASWRGSEFLQFSGWMIVSNLVGNVVVYADRALVAGLFPLRVLPYYNVPLEFLTRLMIVVNGGITVAFPFLSRVAVDEQRLERIHVATIAALAACLAPAFLLVGLLAPVGLELWLGADFRAQSAHIVQILMVGLLFLSLNAFSLASLNARGISRRIALMHLSEAPLYLWALTWFGRRFGLDGIAAVWSARMVMEFVCYSAMHAFQSTSARKQVGGALLGASQSLPLIVLAWLRGPVPALVLCGLSTAVAVAWARLGRQPAHDAVSS